MSKSILVELSFEFALDIVNLYKYLISNSKEYVLSKQLLKSGTSIGANIREAFYAQSKADFISKLSIALKEAYETEYWISLLTKSAYLKEDTALLNDVITKNKSLIRMLISSVRTSKNKLY